MEITLPGTVTEFFFLDLPLDLVLADFLRGMVCGSVSSGGWYIIYYERFTF